MGQWDQSRLGGGGYITGLALDPFDARRLYARCDVAGAFVSADSGASWQARNAGLSRAHEHMVSALVPSPHQPGLVLRCSGDARGGRTYGSIHRSTDHGLTWSEVSGEIDFYGNGPTRMLGEICVFDPHDAGRVYVAGYRAGIWVSDDAGLTWRHQGLAGERIGCLALHPDGRVFAGTVGDAALNGLEWLGDQRLADAILEHGDVPRGRTGSLYVLENGWRRVSRLEDGAFGALAFDPRHPEIILAATSHGVLRSADSGASFTPCSGLDAAKPYNVVRADPHRPGRFLAAPDDGDEDFPLYETLDGGQSWRLLEARCDLDGYPPYIHSARMIGRAISEIVFHPDNPQEFYITGYFGVSRTIDGGRTFSGQGFAGTETTCVEAVVTAGERVYATLVDHVPVVSDDGGRTYRPLPGGPKPTTAFAVSTADPGVLVWGAGSKRQYHRDAHLVRSDDGGRTCTIVRTFKGRRLVQALTAMGDGFFALVDGDVDTSDDSAGLYRSDDAGLTWRRLPSPFPDSVHRLPVEEEWIESELLPVVVYQKRAGAGTNQLLTCAPSGRLYVGEWTLGLYRSDDAGESWQRAGDGLPFRDSRTAVLSCVRADATRVFAGFVREGLWVSDDGGEAWRQLIADVNATSVAVRGDQIVVACEPMWWTGTPARMLVSHDSGHTWRDIHPAEHGAVRWKGVAIDDGGRLHAVSCGNGIYRATLATESRITT